MQTLIAQNAVLQKARELCQTIVDQPEFQALRGRFDTFMSDEAARAHFQGVNEKGEALHHKQQGGVRLTDEEIASFEKDRDALLQNPVVRDFLEAQQEMQEAQQSVLQLVSKTYELGRLPEESDLGGSCGSGCGCH